MKNPRLPTLVKKAINQLAHKLALVEEARLHQHLTDQAREALAGGTPAPQVLALLIYGSIA
jgi:hypothetical protein